MNQSPAQPIGRSAATRRRRRVATAGTVMMVVGLGLLGPAAGCVAPTRAWQPASSPQTLDDMRYVHYLATVPVATVDEGMRAVLMLTGSTQGWPTFEARRAELHKRGAIQRAWRMAPDEILTQGTLAYMLRTVCAMPRSVNETLAALTGLGERRYALRTCIDEGVLPYARGLDAVRGGELLTALSQAEEYLADQ